MTTFENLEFKPSPYYWNGIYARIFFPNGYGASIISGGMAYADYDEYELAVLKGNEDNWELCYTTPITRNVLGWKTKNDITDLLQKIENLPPAA